MRNLYPLHLVEAGDEVTIGFPGGTSFKAIVTEEPSDFRCDVICSMGVRMDVPASLIRSHRVRGHWQAGRNELAA